MFIPFVLDPESITDHTVVSRPMKRFEECALFRHHLLDVPSVKCLTITICLFLQFGTTFSHLIVFYRYFTCELTGVLGIMTEEGDDRKAAAELCDRGGGEMRNLVSAKVLHPVFCPHFSHVQHIFTFHPCPAAFLCLLQRCRGCFVYKCVYIPLGRPNSHHVSFVILISSP